MELWGDNCVQTALYDNYRNEVQYKHLSDRMGKLGFQRNLEQCRQRAKDLRRGFKEIQDGRLHSNRARQTLPFFSLLDRFLMVSRGLVIPKVCANRAKQKGRKSRREELPGEHPFALRLRPDGWDSHRLPLPGQDRHARVPGLPGHRLQAPKQEHCGQTAGSPSYKVQLPKGDPGAQPRGAPSFQLPRQDETLLPFVAQLSGFPLQDPEASAVASHLQQPEMGPAPLNGLSGLWQEMASLAPEGPTSTTALGSAQSKSGLQPLHCPGLGRGGTSSAQAALGREGGGRASCCAPLGWRTL